MRTRSGLQTIVLGGVLFAGSFFGTVLTRSQAVENRQAEASAPTTHLGRWLDLSPDTELQIQNEDPGFPEQLALLRGTLEQERAKLADVFEDPGADNAAIRGQVEAVIAAHNRLERRVAEHIITVRHHLNSEQQQRLFQLCAEGIRKCQQMRWRGGRSEGIGRTDGDEGRGQRGRGRHGQGRGRNR